MHRSVDKSTTSDYGAAELPKAIGPLASHTPEVVFCYNNSFVHLRTARGIIMTLKREKQR